MKIFRRGSSFTMNVGPLIYANTALVADDLELFSGYVYVLGIGSPNQFDNKGDGFYEINANAGFCSFATSTKLQITFPDIMPYSEDVIILNEGVYDALFASGTTAALATSAALATVADNVLSVKNAMPSAETMTPVDEDAQRAAKIAAGLGEG